MMMMDLLERLNEYEDLIRAIKADAEREEEEPRLPCNLAMSLHQVRLYQAEIDAVRGHRVCAERHFGRVERSWESIAESLARIADHLEPSVKATYTAGREAGN